MSGNQICVTQGEAAGKSGISERAVGEQTAWNIQALVYWHVSGGLRAVNK